MEEKIVLDHKNMCQLDYILRNIQESDKAFLKEQILKWAKLMLQEYEKSMSETYKCSLQVLIHNHEKEKAKERASIRDKKYSGFREYYKKIQRFEYDKSHEQGKELKAKGFAKWFLANKPQEIIIPYVKQNQLNKLEQLACQNNREFKENSRHNSAL